MGAYGLKALRMHAAKQEVKVTMSLLENRIGDSSKFYEGLENVKGAIKGVGSCLTAGGYTVALNYLNALIVERQHFPMALLRWKRQDGLFRARSHHVAPDLWTAKTLALERRTLNTFLEMRAQGTPGGLRLRGGEPQVMGAPRRLPPREQAFSGLRGIGREERGTIHRGAGGSRGGGRV